MTSFDVIIDDLGRITLPKTVRNALDVNYGSKLTIEFELKETGEPFVTLTTDTTKEEKPKEKEIIYYFSEYNEKSNIVKISKEQERLLDWLCENDYIRGDVDLGPGYPCVEDLTK